MPATCRTRTESPASRGRVCTGGTGFRHPQVSGGACLDRRPVNMGRSVIVGDQGSLDRCAYQPVVPDGGVEREQALDHAGPQPGGYPAAMVLETELVLQRPDDRLDTLPQPVREVTRLLLVFAGRADQVQAQPGEVVFGVLSGQALA